VVQAIGQDHQADMCQPSCTAQHHFFYVRVCPTHSQTVKPGSKHKRRLDLKMDLSSTDCKGCFQELVQLDKAQLEVPLLYCTAWRPHGCDVPQQTTQNAVL